MDTIKPSSRRYPFCSFKQDREVGNDVLLVEGISKTIDGKKVLNNVSFMIRPHEKVAFVGRDEIARTTLFQILTGEMEPDEGSSVTFSGKNPIRSAYSFDKTLVAILGDGC